MVAAPFGDDRSTPTMQMLQFRELVASKLVAPARRRLARDLFDAAPVAGSAAPDLEIVRTVLVVRGAGYPPPSPATYSIGVVRRALLRRLGNRRCWRWLVDRAR